jgi:hypothetical protein
VRKNLYDFSFKLPGKPANIRIVLKFPNDSRLYYCCCLFYLLIFLTCMIFDCLEESFLSSKENVSCIDDDDIVLRGLIAVSESWAMFSLQVESSFLAHST